MLTQIRSTQVALAMFVVVVIGSHTNGGAKAVLIVSDEFDSGDYGIALGTNVLDVNPAGGINGPGGTWGNQWELEFAPEGGTATLETSPSSHGDYLAVSTKGLDAGPGAIQVSRSIDVTLADNTTTFFAVDVCLKNGTPEEHKFTVDFKGVDDLSFSMEDGTFMQTIGGNTVDVGIDALDDTFYTVVGKIEFDEFGDETFSLWVFKEGESVFPGFGSLGTPDSILQGELGMSKINRLGVTAEAFGSGLENLVGGGVYRVVVQGAMPNGAVPEPSTAVLAGLGLLALVGLGRRRRRSAA